MVKPHEAKSATAELQQIRGPEVEQSPDLAEELQAGVYERLRGRQAEIAQAISVQIRDALSSPAETGDVEYMALLEETVVAVLDYSLTGIAHGVDRLCPVPPVVVAQAQSAAREGIELGMVLRRYVAGYALLGDFVMREAGGLLHQDALRSTQKAQASLLDRLIVSVTDAYTCEVKRMGRSPEQRRLEYVQRLLAGQITYASELKYDLDGWHLGVIARGARGERAVRDLGAALRRPVLPVGRGGDTVWAWFGGQRRLAVDDIEELLPSSWPAGVSLVVGEPEEGPDGFRLTHRQAQAALRVALRKPAILTRYVDVALLAAVLGDDVLARSLEGYLSPLGHQRDGGVALRQTLQAYFAAGHSVKVATSLLGVDRGTVRKRLRIIEQQLGRLLHTCQAELEVALRLEELHQSFPSRGQLQACTRPRRVSADVDSPI